MCGHESEEVLRREALIYKHLGERPNILRCYGLEGVHTGVNALRLEYAPLGDVRGFIKKSKASHTELGYPTADGPRRSQRPGPYSQDGSPAL